MEIVIAFAIGLILGVGVGGSLTLGKIADAKHEGWQSGMNDFAQLLAVMKQEQEKIDAEKAPIFGKKVN
jgi:hypothetical protein